ncbi:porin, partial [uncultured Litoreibacter sp.]|uniref:porin n=1 Tax=uncultured Litoreibacter sp. TaxID=1392394 RepID=UPI0026219596
MKKILIASTALVSTAGIAAADVALSGRAEMGIFQQNTAFSGGAVGSDMQFFTDIDVTFTMSGETDNGLTFGASVDLDEGGAISNA